MSNINIKLFKSLEGEVMSQYRVFQPRLATLREPQYHLKQLIGTGGYGGVFRADQVKGDRFEKEVAIKLVEAKRNDHTQMNELEALVSFSHPNLLKAHLVGDWQFGDDEFLFVVMPLAECSLQDKINKNKLSVSEVKQVVIESAQGLQHLHSQGKIHRDFKPLNLLKENGIWKIADFGLIRDMNGEDYINSNTGGTKLYMPPEAFQGGVTSPAWDIWSLGISIIQAFTQTIPYRFKNDNELIGQLANGNVIMPSDLPSPFDQIVRGCLIKDHKKRWTAEDVLASLKPVNISSNPPRVEPQYRRDVVKSSRTSRTGTGRSVVPLSKSAYKSLSEDVKMALWTTFGSLGMTGMLFTLATTLVKSDAWIWIWEVTQKGMIAASFSSIIGVLYGNLGEKNLFVKWYGKLFGLVFFGVLIAATTMLLLIPEYLTGKTSIVNLSVLATMGGAWGLFWSLLGVYIAHQDNITHYEIWSENVSSNFAGGWFWVWFIALVLLFGATIGTWWFWGLALFTSCYSAAGVHSATKDLLKAKFSWWQIQLWIGGSILSGFVLGALFVKLILLLRN